MTARKAAGTSPVDDSTAALPLDSPDRRDGRAYVMPPNLALAVQVALATGRPLLIRGEPGSGKSSMASFVASEQNWRYYEHVVTSRTTARDLLWTFDSVRRLAEAQSRSAAQLEALSTGHYVEPGVLWWAFARESAARRGEPVATTKAKEPNAELNKNRSPDHAVVLIDEIDKAEPDMPNGLLVPLGSSEFLITDTNRVVTKDSPSAKLDPRQSRHLIVITTNEERELPQAFLRRCVTAWLEQPSGEALVEIAKTQLQTYDGEFTDDDETLARALAEALEDVRRDAKEHRLRPPSTAEYLDALRACRTLGITAGDDRDDRWQQLRDLALLKRQQPQW
jgi:MoxR-like ATPase